MFRVYTQFTNLSSGRIEMKCNEVNKKKKKNEYKLAGFGLESHALHTDESLVFQFNARLTKLKMILMDNTKGEGIWSISASTHITTITVFD
jgi:hypothetical protein